MSGVGLGMGARGAKVAALLMGMLALAATARAETVTSVTQYAYDAAGRPTCAAVRMNPAAFAAAPGACALGVAGSDGDDRITYTAYDAADRVTQVTSGYGAATASGGPRVEKTVTYTDNGKEQTVADGKGNLTTYAYDGFDRLSQVRYPTLGCCASSTTDYEAYGYDAAGNRTSWRRRDGTTVAFAYDALNRAANGLRGEAYAYDNLGRRVSAAYAGQTASAAFDALGRMTSETTNGLTLSYQYDLAGHRTRITWPDSVYVNYDYNAAGEMQNIVENGATRVWAVAYDDLGRRNYGWTGPGSPVVQTFYGYDQASRLSLLDHHFDGFNQTYGWAYTAAGQVRTQSGGQTVFDWSGAQASKTYTTNGLNQYATAAGATLGYDPRGNLTGDGTKTYGYDLLNNLTSTSGGATLSYEPTGRLWQVSASGTTSFLYSGPDLVAEYSGGVLTRRYVPGAGTDAPVLWYEGSGTSDRRWLHANGQGSIVAVTNGAGAVMAINTYDEYGVPAAGNLGRFQYTGQAWIPELGLYHYKARAYSPTLGRFLQTDPIGYGDGLNWYAYVHNDPLNNFDPTGTDCVPGDPRSTCPACVEGKECMASDPIGGDEDENKKKGDAINFDNLKTQLSQDHNSCATGSYTQLSIGGSGTIAIVIPSVGINATLGVSTPDNNSIFGSQFFFSVGVTGTLGVGAYAGVGLSGTKGTTNGPMPIVSGSTANYWEGDAGWGPSLGVSQTIDNKGHVTGTSIAPPVAKPGAGYGAYIGGGKAASVTFATPPIGC